MSAIRRMDPSGTKQIVITGLGMVSALGHDVVTSCAAARAGITRSAELPFSIFEERIAEVVPVNGFPVVGLTEGFSGVGRALRLGSAALADLVSDANLERTDGLQVGMFVNVTDGYLQDVEASWLEGGQEKVQEQAVVSSEATREQQEAFREQFVSSLDQPIALPISDRSTTVYFQGHHGMATAVRDAVQLLRDGELDLCLVGGIDSYLEPERLSTLELLRLLKTSENSAGFMPGEAAAFVLLERLDVASRRGARVKARLDTVSLAKEPIHRFYKHSSAGMALSQAIEELLSQVVQDETSNTLVISDLNGDPWRSSEWGQALVRLPPQGRSQIQAQWYPAASFGETGAATGAIAFCMAVRALERRYAQAERVLICLSSYSGSKGALSVSGVVH